MNKFEILIWLVATYVLFTSVPPITIYGIALFSLFHEFGHAFVASYYGAFKGFGFYGLNIGTRLARDKIPKDSMRLTMSFGMLFNILTMSVIMPMFTFNEAGVTGYLLLVIVMGGGDIYCIIKNRPFEGKRQ